MNSIKVVGTSVVAHTLDPTIQETEAGDSEFKVIPDLHQSSRAVRTTQTLLLCLKKKKVVVKVHMVEFIESVELKLN